jgi:hypothetical protein
MTWGNGPTRKHEARVARAQTKKFTNQALEDYYDDKDEETEEVERGDPPWVQDAEMMAEDEAEAELRGEREEAEESEDSEAEMDDSDLDADMHGSDSDSGQEDVKCVEDSKTETDGNSTAASEVDKKTTGNLEAHTMTAQDSGSS